ncbi:DUF952 domain-containing protein [Marinobacterium arenosum]|uniref:DUF952 domain-containing protein n=1 Tax=Marinobacterium arenosum TaxID=2862496 RepID=UPI001C94EAB9|nr:DUF952 domain-containing protein [Marinobacterium arenosum]MBY4678980.1 DUF952 domain-containing protein [Marinobacterium arenosum]
MNLYRVIKRETWQVAQQSGIVPRCGNDNKADGVHLNLPEAVEHIAALYFTPEEDPVVLEVDTCRFESQIEWQEATADQPWLKPLAKIANLEVASVARVHELEHHVVDGVRRYRFGA